MTVPAWLIAANPDVKDMFTDHDENYHEDCTLGEDPKCGVCQECTSFFPLKDHTHLNCSKCDTEKIFKHSCATKRLTHFTPED